MIPYSFDEHTSREVVGDAHARLIVAQARDDADAQRYAPPESGASTYWGGVVSEMKVILYATQYRKRLLRNERKAAR